MSKINLNNSIYKKIIAGAMTIVFMGSFGGCKGEDANGSIPILPETNLIDMYNAVKDQTIVDDYVESKIDISWFNSENLSDFSNVKELRDKVYSLGTNQLAGLVLDAVSYPLIAVKGFDFSASTGTVKIELQSGSPIYIKIDSENIGSLMNALEVIKSSDVDINVEALLETYRLIVTSTLLTGRFDNNTKKIYFDYDSEKIKNAEENGIVLTNKK